jgi:hypothetical protein
MISGLIGRDKMRLAHQTQGKNAAAAIKMKQKPLTILKITRQKLGRGNEDG